MTPVHFFSHGSTMMLGEDSASARYWERMGEAALKNGVEHVVVMVSSTEPSHAHSFIEDTSLLELQTNRIRFKFRDPTTVSLMLHLISQP